MGWQALDKWACLPRMEPMVVRLGNTLRMMGRVIDFEWNRERAHLEWVESCQGEDGPRAVHLFVVRVAGSELLVWLDQVEPLYRHLPYSIETLPPSLRKEGWLDALLPSLNALSAQLGQQIELVRVMEEQVGKRGDAIPFLLSLGESPVLVVKGALACADSSFNQWMKRVPHAAMPDSGSALAELPLQFDVACGATCLTASQWLSVQIGDVIVVQGGASAISPECDNLSLFLDSVRVRGLALRRARGMVNLRMSHMSADDLEAQPLGSAHPKGQTPADIPLKIDFVIGNVVVTLAELMRLHEGHVFELEVPLRESRVQLRANGRVMAFGELVGVGDRLGVRILAFGPDSYDLDS